MQANAEYIVMYCRPGCEDSDLARAVLRAHRIPFREIDISADPQARYLVRNINNGYESTPTILFPDGRILVEPTEQQLLQALEELGAIFKPKGGDAREPC